MEAEQRGGVRGVLDRNYRGEFVLGIVRGKVPIVWG